MAQAASHPQSGKPVNSGFQAFASANQGVEAKDPRLVMASLPAIWHNLATKTRKNAA